MSRFNIGALCISICITLMLIGLPLWLMATLIGCQTNTAKIFNHSDNAVLATLKLNDDLVLWRGEIKAGHAVEPAYRTARDGVLNLIVEAPGKRLEFRGSSFGSGLLTGSSYLDVFVIESERIVDATKRPSSRNFVESVEWFCRCAVQSVRDLAGIGDPHRPSPTKDRH